MHSSRAVFSSLHTQQGFTAAAAWPGGLRSVERFAAVGEAVELGESAVDDMMVGMKG